MSIIYKTTNLINGLIYIGQHYTSANDGYLGSGHKLKENIKLLGKENFKREILEFINFENSNYIDNREEYWINLLNTRNPSIGYNISKGGNSRFMLGVKHSDKSKKQMSLSHKGIPQSEENKKKISKKLKGRKLSEKTKKLVSINHNKKSNEVKYIYCFEKCQNKLIIDNLNKFCNNNKYFNASSICIALKRNQNYYKNWKISRIRKI